MQRDLGMGMRSGVKHGGQECGVACLDLVSSNRKPDIPLVWAFRLGDYRNRRQHI